MSENRYHGLPGWLPVIGDRFLFLSAVLLSYYHSLLFKPLKYNLILTIFLILSTKLI